MNHQEGDTDWITSFYAAAVEWWGESWYDGENLKSRMALVKKYARDTDKRILELAAGTGETAVYFCDHGYQVLAVDITPRNIEIMTKIQKGRPNLRVAEGDFLTIRLNERFPTVCIFESFGLGSDKDQQKLLRRVHDEWLMPNGILILDVYHPYGPIRASGTERKLGRLENVPGSVEMTEYSYYDPIKSRWIDIWEPVNDKSSRKIQSIRCYTPADFILLAESSGLIIEEMLYAGKAFNYQRTDIVSENIFDHDGRDRNDAYTVIMRKRNGSAVSP